MTKTSTEVIAEAHRRIRVLSVDEDPSSDQITYAGTHLDAIIAEETVTWTRDTVPDDVFRPLAWLVAADIGPHYASQGAGPVEGRGRALQRFHGAIYPNDMEDRRDVDEDGTISDAEEEAGKRAAFF